jgi:hypothetical protein
MAGNGQAEHDIARGCQCVARMRLRPSGTTGRYQVAAIDYETMAVRIRARQDMETLSGETNNETQLRWTNITTGDVCQVPWDTHPLLLSPEIETRESVVRLAITAIAAHDHSGFNRLVDEEGQLPRPPYPCVKFYSGGYWDNGHFTGYIPIGFARLDDFDLAQDSTDGTMVLLLSESATAQIRQNQAEVPV